jgi:hypothetical protein
MSLAIATIRLDPNATRIVDTSGRPTSSGLRSPPNVTFAADLSPPNVTFGGKARWTKRVSR